MDIKLFIKNLLFWNKVDIELKNIIEWKGKFRNARLKVRGKDNKFYLGKNSIIKNSKLSIRGNNNKIIFDDGCSVRRMILKFQGNNSVLRIGKNTSIEGIRMEMNDGKIEIGDNCIVSYGIEMRNTDSHDIFYLDKKINPNKDIIIENNVWIGARNIILKGTRLGEGSILGAGSVVSKEFGKNMIVAGNPAKKIKEGIRWEK